MKVAAKASRALPALARDLQAKGFGRDCSGLARELYASFSATVLAAKGTDAETMAWAICRALALDLHRIGEADASLALLRGLIAFGSLQGDPQTLAKLRRDEAGIRRQLGLEHPAAAAENAFRSESAEAEPPVAAKPSTRAERRPAATAEGAAIRVEPSLGSGRADSPTPASPGMERAPEPVAPRRERIEPDLSSRGRDSAGEPERGRSEPRLPNVEPAAASAIEPSLLQEDESAQAQAASELAGAKDPGQAGDLGSTPGDEHPSERAAEPAAPVFATPVEPQEESAVLPAESPEHPVSESAASTPPEPATEPLSQAPIMGFKPRVRRKARNERLAPAPAAAPIPEAHAAPAEESASPEPPEAHHSPYVEAPDVAKAEALGVAAAPPPAEVAEIHFADDRDGPGKADDAPPGEAQPVFSTDEPASRPEAVEVPPEVVAAELPAEPTSPVPAMAPEEAGAGPATLPPAEIPEIPSLTANPSTEVQAPQEPSVQTVSEAEAAPGAQTRKGKRRWPRRGARARPDLRIDLGGATRSDVVFDRVGERETPERRLEGDRARSMRARQEPRFTFDGPEPSRTAETISIEPGERANPRRNPPLRAPGNLSHGSRRRSGVGWGIAAAACLALAYLATEEWSRIRETVPEVTKSLPLPDTARVMLSRPPTAGTATADAATGTVSDTTETIPPPGQGRALTVEEVRYCVFQGRRLSYLRGDLSGLGGNDLIQRYNGMVSDFNARCRSFRYENDALQKAQREAESRQPQLQAQAAAILSSWRAPSAQPLLDLRATEAAARVQMRLKELGFYRGTVDGVWGPKSRMALMSFKQSNGLGSGDSWDLGAQAALLGP